MDPQGQEAAADALSSRINVEAAASFAIKGPAKVEVAIPRGLRPREHPAQTERWKRERIRGQDSDVGRQVDDMPHAHRTLDETRPIAPRHREWRNG